MMPSDEAGTPRLFLASDDASLSPARRWPLTGFAAA